MPEPAQDHKDDWHGVAALQWSPVPWAAAPASKEDVRVEEAQLRLAKRRRRRALAAASLHADHQVVSAGGTERNPGVRQRRLGRWFSSLVSVRTVIVLVWVVSTTGSCPRRWRAASLAWVHGTVGAPST